MKILPFGVAVLEHDTHIGKWVEQKKSLAIAESLLRPLRKHIPAGATVVDAGANIGDHCATYSRYVGTTGRVFAFEPNPDAYDCLAYNMDSYENVYCVRKALSDQCGEVQLQLQDNVGASYISASGGVTIQTTPLDMYELSRLDFLKIDVEGHECALLRGAEKTIRGCQPVMLVEINHGALERAGDSAEKLLNQIRGFGYEIKRIDPGQDWNDPQYDILATPINYR